MPRVVGLALCHTRPPTTGQQAQRDAPATDLGRSWFGKTRRSTAERAEEDRQCASREGTLRTREAPLQPALRGDIEPPVDRVARDCLAFDLAPQARKQEYFAADERR
jgi:hypothetical protein